LGGREDASIAAMRTRPPPARPDELLPPWSLVPEAIVDAGLWCAIEICIDIPAQRWEPRLLICLTDVPEIVREIVRWIDDVPMWDVRITGYTREELCREHQAPTALCHVAL
jgi:hypothetical protein